MLAIYSTLGLTPRWVGLLGDRALTGLFVAGFALVLATIVTQGLKVRPGGAEIAVVLGIAATYLLVLTRFMIPLTERTHLIEYGVIAVFISEALIERSQNGGSVPAPRLLAIGVSAILGVLDESLQWLLPSRVFDPRDILFNVLAAVMAVAATALLAKVRSVGP